MTPPLRTAALSWGITCALLLLGVAVFAFAGSGLPSAQNVPLWIAWSLGWKVVLWAAMLAALALWRPRVRLYIAAAAVAATLDILLTNIWVFSFSAVFALPGWILTIAAFTVVAAIGCLLATGGARVLPIVTAVAMTIGGALTLSFPYQWLRVYFTLGGPAPIPSDADAAKYAATAIAALAFTIAGLVLAAVQRRRALIVLAAVLLGLTLLLGFMFQVPQGRWVPTAPEPEPYNSNYVPCYGEGDPNCVGG